jgi:hypothetical protein
MPPRLTFTRTEHDTAIDVGYMRADGQYAAVRIADTSDAETIAKQLQVLAEMMTRPAWAESMRDSFNNQRRE